MREIPILIHVHPPFSGRLQSYQSGQSRSIRGAKAKP